MNRTEMAARLEESLRSSDSADIVENILQLANLLAERRHLYAAFIPVGNSTAVAVQEAEAELQDRVIKAIEESGLKTNAEQRAALLVTMKGKDSAYQAVLHESNRVVMELQMMENQLSWGKRMFLIDMENMAHERTLASLLDG